MLRTLRLRAARAARFRRSSAAVRKRMSRETEAGGLGGGAFVAAPRTATSAAAREVAAAVAVASRGWGGARRALSTESAAPPPREERPPSTAKLVRCVAEDKAKAEAERPEPTQERWEELRNRKTDMSHVSVKPGDVDLVLYHASCWDGAGAAWAAHRVLGDEVEYRACHHNSRLPPVRGRTVAMLDIAFDANVMRHVQHYAKDFVVLDHHVSAEKALEAIDDKHKVFDSSQSGAALAWQFFHPNEPVPDVLLYVEDRDIWNWQLPNSEAFNASIMNERPTFEMFEAVYQGGAEEVSKRITEGGFLHDFASRVHANIASKARMRTFGNGMRAAVVNSPYFKSEIGNLLAEVPEADFGLVWHWDMGRREFQCSLRVAADKKVDATAIAGEFGGGGHEKAAAFRFDGETIEELFDNRSERARRARGPPTRGGGTPAAHGKGPLLRRHRSAVGSKLV